MKAFKVQKILIPVDFSETSMIALDHAGMIAQKFNAELVLLHVIERHWEQFSIIAPELVVPVPTNITEAIESKLEETATDIQSRYGILTSSVISDGNIFAEIISVSKEHHIDVIVMGTHGTKGVVEFFIGSNTYKVVTESTCPVISVQSKAKTPGFKNILLPIDDSNHSRQKVTHAVMMAKNFGATIHIVGLHDYSDESDVRKFEMKLDQVQEYIKKGGISFTSKIIEGTNQARVTYDHAKVIGADLILIMTDQDENITGRLMGTYAQQIVNHSKIPVMSIQPVVSHVDWIHPY
ncbi:MAG: universal stress protein [Bacteroidota bacterium]|nr:universal stress protein [Bacteroidota bacterium]